MSVEAAQFKNALRLWASGVTVVTAYSAAEGAKGMTATSFCSVSMEPAQVLVCLNQSTDTGAVVLESGKFAVNVLTASQQAESNQFAGGATQQQRFEATRWELSEFGVPVLADALVTLECQLVQQVTAGTHWVMIGEIMNVICRSGEPLLYFDGSYRELLALNPA